MARFTDEKKWSDKWFRSLSSQEKLVWIYLCDNCDIAGFYEIDHGYIAFHLGITEGEAKGAIEGLSRGYLGAGEFIWIKNFLKHQKNHILNPVNNCHKGIIKRIKEKLSLFPTIPDVLGADQGLFSPIGKGKGKGKGNVSTDKKTVFIPPELQEVKDYFTTKGYTEDSATRAFHYYNTADWVDGQGNKVRSWKQKMIAVWFKQENKRPTGSTMP